MKLKMAFMGITASFCGVASNPAQFIEGTQASTTWLVLDDLAYHIYENVGVDFTNKEITAFNNDITNCLQTNNDPPLDSGVFTLLTDTQEIGLKGQVDYDLGRKAIILTSETEDLVCDGAFEFDRIYVDDFD